MKQTLEEKQFEIIMKSKKRKLEELNDCKERVAWLLARHELLRNSDQALIFHYWKEVDGYNGEMDDRVMDLTPAESIRRSRQLIQNAYGLYPPTDEKVIQQRELNESIYHEWAGIQARMARAEEHYAIGV